MITRKKKKHVCLNLIEELYMPFKAMCEADYMNASTVINKYMATILKERSIKNVK